MQPRYFIGILVPGELSKVLTNLRRELYIPKVIMEPLMPHITLLHPNILETSPPSHFIPKVKVIAQTYMPITIQLESTDLFDQRVLHISVNSPSLIELQKELTALLPEKIRAQYEVGRKFTPHVTLAQAKPLQKLPVDLINTYRSQVDPLLPLTFTTRNLTQFTWQRPRTYKLSLI